MNTPSKLIKWQRITITVLLIALISASIAAHQEKQAAKELLASFERRHIYERQVIRTLDDRLTEYEIKYDQRETVRDGH